MLYSPTGDLLQDLGMVDQRATNQGPQTNPSSRIMLPLGDKPSKPNTSFIEASTQTFSPAVTDAEPVRCTTPPVGTEGENWYLLVVTALIGQLSLESASNGLKVSLTALHGGRYFPKPTNGSCSLCINKGGQLWKCHHEGAGGVV